MQRFRILVVWWLQMEFRRESLRVVSIKGGR
jgi:hypothetical protein